MFFNRMVKSRQHILISAILLVCMTGLLGGSSSEQVKYVDLFFGKGCKNYAFSVPYQGHTWSHYCAMFSGGKAIKAWRIVYYPQDDPSSIDSGQQEDDSPDDDHTVGICNDCP